MDANAIASSHTLRAKNAGQPVRTIRERRIRERRACITNGFAIRSAHRGSIDGVRQQVQHRHHSPSSRETMLRWMSDVPE